MGRVYEWGHVMRNNKGIILLEVLIGMILMSMILVGIWGSFYKIYDRYLAIHREGEKRQEINTVLEFIQKEVEGAEKIRIETHSIKDIIEIQEEIVDEQIKCIVFIPNKEEPQKNQTDLWAVLKGSQYEIIYQNQTVGEGIAKLTVSKAEYATLVEIRCDIEDKKGEMISESIILSLLHKQ